MSAACSWLSCLPRNKDSSDAVQSQRTSIAKCGNLAHLTSLVSDLARKRARAGRNGRFLASSMHCAGPVWAACGLGPFCQCHMLRSGSRTTAWCLCVNSFAYASSTATPRERIVGCKQRQVWLRAYGPRPYLRATWPCIINPHHPSAASVGLVQQPTLIADLWIALWTSIHHFSRRQT